jgi:hypothetical protein
MQGKEAAGSGEADTVSRDADAFKNTGFGQECEGMAICGHGRSTAIVLNLVCCD